MLNETPEMLDIPAPARQPPRPVAVMVLFMILSRGTYYSGQ